MPIKIVLAQLLKQETISGSIKSTNLKVLKEALAEILKADIVQQNNQLLIGMD